MQRLFSCLLVLLSLTLSRPAQAQEIACGENYRVVAGDSLSSIARRAYGRASAYQRIFDFNPGVLTNPNLVRVRTQLFIPCLDTPEGQRADAAGATETGTAAIETEALAPIRPSRGSRLKILTGADYAPYVDDDLPEGGFSTELLERALQSDDGAADYRIDVIRDWGSHLEPLLSDGAYDLGYPWFRPDCSRVDLLGEHSRWRCRNLHFSEPLHEVVVTHYVRSEEGEMVKMPEDVFGMRLCRPTGYFTHDLEVIGLAPPVIERVAPDKPEECFEMLAAGTVDIVSLNADTSDRVVTALGISDRVAEVLPLASIQTLHVVGMKTNPATRPNLLRVSKGLIALRESGEVRRIAAKHLAN